jgi:hypothetical protein
MLETGKKRKGFFAVVLIGSSPTPLSRQLRMVALILPSLFQSFLPLEIRPISVLKFTEYFAHFCLVENIMCYVAHKGILSQKICGSRVRTQII